MAWSTIFLIIAIVCLVLAIWKLSKGLNFIPAVIGIVWFFVVLLQQFLPKVYNASLIQGFPALGTIFIYVILPVLFIINILGMRFR